MPMDVRLRLTRRVLYGMVPIASGQESTRELFG